MLLVSLGVLGFLRVMGFLGVMGFLEVMCFLGVLLVFVVGVSSSAFLERYTGIDPVKEVGPQGRERAVADTPWRHCPVDCRQYLVGRLG